MFYRLEMKDIPIKVMDWDEAYQITLEKPDTIIFSLTKIAERKNKFKWVGPIATKLLVFICKEAAGRKWA